MIIPGDKNNLARFSRRDLLTLSFGILIGGGGLYALPRYLSSDTLSSDDTESRPVTRAQSPTSNPVPEPELIEINPEPITEPVIEPAPEPSPPPLPPPPRPTTNDNRTRVRFLEWKSPGWEDRPDFFWATPIRSEPGIKAFWVQIDQRGWLPLQPRTRNWKMPVPMRPGTHEFFVMVEYVDGVVGPPTSIFFTLLAGLPDFVFGDVFTEPENPKVGETFKVSAIVRNEGRLDFVARNYHLPIHQKPIRPTITVSNASGEPSREAFNELRVGEEFRVNFPLPITFQTAGEYEITLLMNLDPILDLRSPESDYENNRKTFTIVVS